MTAESSSNRREVLLEELHQAIGQLSGQSVIFSDAIARTLGLHSTDLECLSMLWFLRDMSAGELATQTGLTTGAITGVIDRLERAGYVRRETDPQDRRRVMVRLDHEKAGREVAPYFAFLHQGMTSLCERYSDDELAVVADFCVRSLDVSREATARVQSLRHERHQS